MAKHQPYKKQHFVPAVYLSRFGQYNEDAPRETLIWAYDVGRNKCYLQKVENLCCPEYFYDQIDPADSEMDLKILEDAYGRAITKLESIAGVDDNDIYRLFQFTILMHVRNASFKNTTNIPRIEHVRNAFATSLIRFQGRNPVEFKNNWIGSPLASSSGAFLTSDNPCVFYRDKASEHAKDAIPRLIYMPITPFAGLIFVKKPWRIKSQMASDYDMGILSGSVSMQRNQYVFTPNNQFGQLKGDLEHIIPEKDRGFYAERQMATNHWVMDKAFSFLEEVTHRLKGTWISPTLLALIR